MTVLSFTLRRPEFRRGTKGRGINGRGINFFHSPAVYSPALNAALTCETRFVPVFLVARAASQRPCPPSRASAQTTIARGSDDVAGGSMSGKLLHFRSRVPFVDSS